MSARTQHKQFSRKDAPRDGGEYPLNSFPPNLAEVLKTKMLEGKGFEILERLPCCWLLNTAPKQFAAEWITVWHFSHLLYFPSFSQPCPGQQKAEDQKKKPHSSVSYQWGPVLYLPQGKTDSVPVPQLPLLSTCIYC